MKKKSWISMLLVVSLFAFPACDEETNDFSESVVYNEISDFNESIISDEGTSDSNDSGEEKYTSSELFNYAKIPLRKLLLMIKTGKKLRLVVDLFIRQMEKLSPITM